MLETYADYSTELSEEERELGFELVEVQNSCSQFETKSVQAVVYRFSECDQIVKMNVPVIGGHSYRHERLSSTSTHSEGDYTWHPANTVVFPTAVQALDAIGNLNRRPQLCH